MSAELTQKLNNLRQSILKLSDTPAKNSLYSMLESLQETLEEEAADRHYQKMCDSPQGFIDDLD